MSERKTRRGNREGSYSKRSGGRWQYRIEVNGHRVVGSGRTKAEAKDKAKERARLIGDQRTRDSVSELVERWCALAPGRIGLAATTADQYRSLLRSRVLPALGEVRVERLTKRQVADFLNQLDASASTRRSTYAALVRLLGFAAEQGIVGVNVAREVPRPSSEAPPRRDVTEDEARALLGAATGHRWEVAAWLGLGCGMRRGEILGLRWSAVDLESGVLTVTADGNLTRSSAGLAAGRPKTRRGVRQIPLPPQVVIALRAHKKRQAAERLAAAFWQDTGYVLANEVGSPVEPRSLSRAWRSWAKTAGLSDTGTHVGRHFAATTLLGSGRASVADVASALGHDPSVLLSTYAAAIAEGQRAAAEALGATLTAPVSAPVEPRQ